jgi:two-component system cell cycle response regulator
MRWLRRVVADTQLLLALTVALGAVAVAVAGNVAEVKATLAAAALLIAAQAAIALSHRRARKPFGSIATGARFGLTVGFVTVATAIIGDPSIHPAAVLYLPVVALAAVHGARPAFFVGGMALAAYLLPVLYAAPEQAAATTQRAVALAVTAIVLSIGTRRTVSALTLAMAKLGRSHARDRRRSRQVAAVEGVGRLLAARGPIPEALDRVVRLLRDDLGYAFVSLYLGNSSLVRLAAQGGYTTVIETFDGSTGVVGRVMRTRATAFVADVKRDADYVSASDRVGAEISVPLLVDNDLIGIVNVEATPTSGLDASDVETMTLVAERLASALALAREREALADRAELFRRLATFSSAVNGTLDPAGLHRAIVSSLTTVVAADVVVLTVLDRSSGKYLTRAIAGADERYVGLEVNSGEGLAGRAIRDRAPVVDDRYDRSRYPVDLTAEEVPESVAGIAVPLVRDDVVVGALTLVRLDVQRPFGRAEREVLPILADLTALAVTNTFLHAEVAESSIRDPLTNLYNRRHLDGVLARIETERSRLAADDRGRLAIIMFDLDHFGAVNKDYGHQVGDAVLRHFSEILRRRLRSSDLIARYGGEEFVVVLDGATLEKCVELANRVRVELGESTVDAADGTRLSVQVSAGCAAIGADLGTVFDALAQADVALVMAKRAGRNRVVAA